MILPQKLGSLAVHRYHTSRRMETTVSIEVDSGERTTGNLQRGKGKRKHLFCPCCKTCPTHLGAEQYWLQRCSAWHSQTLAWGLGLSERDRKEIRNLILVCSGFVPLSDDGAQQYMETLGERNATAGCPNYQRFECTYSSSLIPSYIHIVSNFFMPMLD